ncbi:MAG: hypothetical protein EA358_07430 [Flavobacteriales bacterium]|nr:MAG: hypothetical protein EA358_07430 [Flavobacteriales bacterium]
MHLYSLMITLDDEANDVIRQIAISGEKTLLELHDKIVEAFELPKDELASFYYVEGNWEMAEEITLEKFDEKSPFKAMGECSVDELFGENERLVYVNDFLKLWTFFIERVKTAQDTRTEGVLLSIGKLPEKAPDKEFEIDIMDDFIDEWNEEDQDFSNDEDNW